MARAAWLGLLGLRPVHGHKQHLDYAVHDGNLTIGDLEDDDVTGTKWRESHM